MKRFLDSSPVALVRLLANGAILVVGFLFLVAWCRGDPLAWTQLSPSPPGIVDESRSASGVLRLEISLPKDCSFHCGLGSDHLVVRTVNPTHVHLSVRREDAPARPAGSSVTDVRSQKE